MKPTQIAELFANTKKTFVSFFSILMFVALGVGIFLGITWTAPALHNAADKVLDEGTFHDIQIQYLYGLTEDDIDKLSQVEGVSKVEVARQSFESLIIDSVAYTVKVHSIGNEIDIPIVADGSLPRGPGEIALQKASANRLGLGIGDVVTFQGGNVSPASGKAYLVSDTFTVTALVDSPEYIANSTSTFGLSVSSSGSVDALSWVSIDSFDPSAFLDAYPVVNVRCDSLRGLSTFSDSYKDKVSSIEPRITSLGDALGTARYDDLHDQALGKIEEGEGQLNEGWATLNSMRADAESKLADGYRQLQEYEALKAEAEETIANAKEFASLADEALTEAEALRDSVVNGLAEYKAKGEKAKDIYEASDKTAQDKQQYDDALDAYGAEIMQKIAPYAERLERPVPVIDHDNYFDRITQAQELIDDFENLSVTYEGRTITVHTVRELLDEAKQTLSDAEAELNDKIAQLNEGWNAYYAARNELASRVLDAEAQLAEGEDQLAAIKGQLAAMQRYSWTVLPRSYNGGVAQAVLLSNVMGNLSFSMAALFIIVGLLVSYSAVSRIVHEQITQSGTKKALGLYAREITVSFLAYSALAVISGAIIGTAVGVTLVEGIIGHVVGGMFVFGDYAPYFDIVSFLLVTALELILVLGATWLACHKILKENAVELLKGEKPPEGKTRFYEKWEVWDRLPLLTQTIVNNCVNDKRRVFSTIVGVAGCTALIVTAITLNNDVMKSYDKQYEDVYGFNAITYMNSSTDDALKASENAYSELGVRYAPVLRKSFVVQLPESERGTIRSIVPLDSESFGQLYRIRSITDDPIDLTKDGAWVSQAYAKHYGAKIGDDIVVNGSDGMVHHVPILGFYEYWLVQFEMVMGNSYYEKEFGTPSANVLLTDSGNYSVSELREMVSEVASIDSIANDKLSQGGNFKTFSNVSTAVVGIYLALAVLMAMVVLLNLNVMFIEEKKRELIVLMINGFSVKDAKRYIYNDSIVLTAIGIVFGLILGCIMGSITVGSVEPSTATFVKSIDWVAVVAGIAGSAILAFVMSAIAMRRIPKFNLTDINKA